MALTAQRVIDDAQRILQDVAGDRWADADLAKDLHRGRLDMLELRPDIYAQRTTLTLAAGAEQAITGRRFLAPVCNVSSVGAFGSAVTPANADDLDAIVPGWRSGKEKSVIVHTVFEEDRPGFFEVYPPAVAGTKLRLSQSVEPAEITVLSNTLDPEGPNAVALVHYVVFSALSQDQEVPQAAQLAQVHYGLYLQALGATKRAALMVSPNFREKGGTPPPEMRAAANG